jgi:Na+/H+ antiporter NhaC
MVVKDFIGSDLFLLIIPLIPFALAFIGMHPAVGLALVAEALNPKALGISVEITAIAMLAGATMAFMMGPYNATTNIMATLTGKSSYQVSNWNAPFTLLYLILAMLLLLLLKNVG